MTLDDLEMILQYIYFSPQNCVKMRDLLSFDNEKATTEYIFKRIGTKSTKMKCFCEGQKASMYFLFNWQTCMPYQYDNYHSIYQGYISK